MQIIVLVGLFCRFLVSLAMQALAGFRGCARSCHQHPTVACAKRRPDGSRVPGSLANDCSDHPPPPAADLAVKWQVQR